MKEEEKRRKHNGNYFTRRWDEVVDDVEHPEDIADNIGKDFEDTVDTLEEDEREVTNFVNNVPDYSYKIWLKMRVLEWIINLYLFGVPWLFILVSIFGWNMYINVFWNKWWAEGNLFLIANTTYIWI